MTRGFVINANITTNTDTVVANLINTYHEWLLKYTHTNQYQFNESYKYIHMLTTFPPKPPVAYTLVQAALISAQRRYKQDQNSTNNGITIGTQEGIHQPQQVTFNECLVNVPTFET